MSHSRLIVLFAATVASSIGQPDSVQAQCHYDVTIIQAPECPIFGIPPINGFGLNALGHVVGSRWWSPDPAASHASGARPTRTPSE